MEQKLSKRLLLIVLKYIPWLIAVGYLFGTIFATLGWSTAILTNFVGLSVLPTVLILISSFALGFCIWHRLPIYYTIVANWVNLYDYLIGFSFATIYTISIYLFLFVITVLLGAYFKNRHNVRKRNTKTRSI